MELDKEIFIEQLKSQAGKDTIEYLKARGITGETAKLFELGYSMERSPSLYSILKPNYEKVDLEDSGLFGANDNGDMYDRFRDRLMFPIRNVKGDHIAFGGRLIKDKKDQASEFLEKFGNPYDDLVVDKFGKHSIDFGVYGIPESILINNDLMIIKKFVGPLSDDDYHNIIKIIEWLWN